MGMDRCGQEQAPCGLAVAVSPAATDVDERTTGVMPAIAIDRRTSGNMSIDLDCFAIGKGV
jgi:hypothetical protein